MTIRIPAIVLTGLLVLAGMALISFVVAVLVYEWRQSDYIDCITEVESDYLDQYQAHRATRPDYTGNSDGAYRQYQDQFTKFLEAGDIITENWVSEMRACG